MTSLQIAWFFLVGLLLTGYAILDGFDLGTGFWYLLNRKDRHRRMMLGAIGPVWDGNEVWLITGGGALFAAFPAVYASVFSGMYLALLLVLLGLIMRATSIEFRGQVDDPRWKKAWDGAFGIGSLLPALLFGVALGNLLGGMSLNEHGDYTGGFFRLLDPYALSVGLLGLVMLIVHGGLYLVWKTEGELQDNIKRGLARAWFVYVALFTVVGLYTILGQRQLLANFSAWPVLWLIPVLAFVGIVLIRVWSTRGHDGKAFLSSAGTIACLMATTGALLFPNLVPAANDPSLSLTLANSSSGALTLKVMLIVAIIGMPAVLAYNAWVYRTFAGKVKPEELEY